MISLEIFRTGHQKTQKTTTTQKQQQQQNKQKTHTRTHAQQQRKHAQKEISDYLSPSPIIYFIIKTCS